MSSSTPTTARNRLRRLKKEKTGTSPLIEMSSKSLPSEAAKIIDNIKEPNSNYTRDDHIAQEKDTTSPTANQPTYRNYDMYTSSPCYIPNSQAPMPDREVYWDLDTPQTRKCREQLRKQIESISTPESERRCQERVAAPAPKLELAVNMKSVTRSQEQIKQDQRGEEVLTELMELCREQEDGGKKDSVNFKEERICYKDNGQDNISMESDMFNSDISFLSSESEVHTKAVVIKNETSDVELLGESFSNLSNFNEGDAFNDGCGVFDDDDDSFLIHASQVADQAIPVVPQNKAISKLKAEDKEEGFGSDDDSFDLFMSQMDHSNKVTDQKEQPQRTVKQEPTGKHNKPEVLDDLIQTGIEISTNTSPVLKRRRKSRNIGDPPAKEFDNHQETIRKSPVNQQSVSPLDEINVKSVMKKYSSFDNGMSSQQVKAAEKKKYFQFQRVKSSPDINRKHINQGQIINKVLPSNSIIINSKHSKETSSGRPKEDMKTLIERKKREALAKRASSLSQKQNR